MSKKMKSTEKIDAVLWIGERPYMCQVKRGVLTSMPVTGNQEGEMMDILIECDENQCENCLFEQCAKPKILITKDHKCASYKKRRWDTDSYRNVITEIQRYSKTKVR